MSGDYAGLAIGNLHVNGTISGPGAPSGGGVTGFGSVTGNYGTVQTTGSSAGGYDGYSIHGRYVFMSAGTLAGGNHQCGIYNELDGNWVLFFYRNTYARLFYNGAPRLETTNNGITVTGSTYNTSDDRIKYNEEEVINCVNIINQLTPVKYEKLNQPEDIVGTWIPTDDEWESKKSNYGWYNEFGFIAQDVRKIPGLDILVKGEETEEIEIIKTELEYNKFSEEMRTKYTYRPDTKDYIHNDSGPTQVPLTINYTGFIPIITGAVKELSSALEQEKQKTENLQTRLTASEQAYQALLERVVALESA
jgi:flagellar biosynthesis chaperone FliJ